MEKLAYNVPEFGTVTKVADDLFWARFTLPFRLNHINLYIIDTPDGWVLIDAGINAETTAAQWRALLDGPLATQPVHKIIVTHHHVDHIGFAGPLCEMTGAPLFMSAGEETKARWLLEQDDEDFAKLVERTYRAYGLDEANCALARSDKGRFARHVAPIPQAAHLKAGDKILSRNGCFEVRLDEGHSQSHIGLIDQERGLYIAMDFLLPRISPNISVDLRDLSKDLLGAYLSYLDGIKQMDESWHIFPGHDWPFTKGASRAKDLISHHHERLDALCIAAANGPLTVDEAMGTLFGKRFEAHELYFASGEARAHLTHLVATGRMNLHKDMNGQAPDYFALSQP